MGLPATVADPQYLLDWLHPDAGVVPKDGADRLKRSVGEGKERSNLRRGAAGQRVVHVRPGRRHISAF